MARYSHKYFIEAGGRKYNGGTEINGTFSQSDSSEQQGQTAAMTTAVTTLLTAINTFKSTAGNVRSIKIF